MHAQRHDAAIVPSTFPTGYKYAGLGYTTAFDAAIAPLAARHAHDEFADTPCIDKGFFALMGNNHYIMRAIQRREPEKLKAFVGWLLGAAKGYAAKLVNPGGVEIWKNRQAGNVKDLDSAVDHFGVTPRQIIAGGRTGRRRASPAAPGPPPLHQPRPAGQLDDDARDDEAARRPPRAPGPHPVPQLRRRRRRRGRPSARRWRPSPNTSTTIRNLTVDVGQVVFGQTMSMTADGPVGYFLSRLYRSKWFSNDIEQETGCGIVPIEYKNTSLVHAWQWAIGLEWYLLVNDPWRVAMSTDHPNGGSFLAYPQIIRLLMDRTYRRDMLATLPAAVRERDRR